MPDPACLSDPLVMAALEVCRNLPPRLVEGIEETTLRKELQHRGVLALHRLLMSAYLARVRTLLDPLAVDQLPAALGESPPVRELGDTLHAIASPWRLTLLAS